MTKEPFHVRFRALKPFQHVSHKSWCPICEDGLLLMLRDEKTLTLLADDVCTLCGRRFVYDDIEDVRVNGGHP